MPSRAETRQTTSDARLLQEAKPLPMRQPLGCSFRHDWGLLAPPTACELLFIH